MRQFIRTSSFSKKHKTSSLIQNKIKTFENSTTPVKATLIKTTLLKISPDAKDEEVPVIREPAINPFLKAVSVNLNEEEEEATQVFNKSETKNTTKVSNYTFLIFNRTKKTNWMLSQSVHCGQCAHYYL